MVDREGLLGEEGRVPERGRGHEGADADARGPRCETGERRPRFIRVDDEVIRDPQAIESERLQLLPLGDQGGPGLARANEDTKLRQNNGHSPASQTSVPPLTLADDGRILRAAVATVKQDDRTATISVADTNSAVVRCAPR